MSTAKKMTAREEANLLQQASEILKAREMEPAEHTKPARAALYPAVPATPRDADEDSHGFKTPREFVTSVLKAYTADEQGMSSLEKIDKRLVGLSGRAVQKAQAERGVVVKAAGSDEGMGINDPYGGFLVPTTFSPNLMKLDPEADPMSGRVTTIPMGNPIVKIPARVDKDHTTSVSGGVTVTRRPETVAASPTRTEFEQVVLHATTLAGLSHATEELLTDSPISFAAIIAAGFNDQFTYHLVKERISGTGVGEFEGVLNTPALVTVSAEDGQPADTIVYQNIVKMRSRCWGYGKSVWLANHDTFPQLSQLKLDIGTGGSAMYQPSLREDRPDLLLGRPVIYTEYAKKLGDVGDLILGNWSEYLEGTYMPLRSDESIHVRFDRFERTFRFWVRNDARCWWRSALTPVNSTATLSPFVVLAAR